MSSRPTTSGACSSMFIALRPASMIARSSAGRLTTVDKTVKA